MAFLKAGITVPVRTFTMQQMLRKAYYMPKPPNIGSYSCGMD